MGALNLQGAAPQRLALLAQLTQGGWDLLVVGAGDTAADDTQVPPALRKLREKSESLRRGALQVQCAHFSPSAKSLPGFMIRLGSKWRQSSASVVMPSGPFSTCKRAA